MKDLEPLTTEQATAVLEALVLAAFANGHLADDEHDVLVELALRVPALCRRDPDEVREMVERERARLVSLDERGVIEAVERAGAQLPRGPAAEAALRMFARVCYADGVIDPYERAVALAFARSLELDPARVQAVFDELAARK